MVANGAMAGLLKAEFRFSVFPPVRLLSPCSYLLHGFRLATMGQRFLYWADTVYWAGRPVQLPLQSQARHLHLSVARAGGRLLTFLPSSEPTCPHAGARGTVGGVARATPK